jgi:hypothetical protein
MRLSLVAVVVFFTSVPAAAQKPPVQFSVPAPSEWVHIDGAKNPELIPEWSVWKHAFMVFGVASELPTDVMKHLSKEEAAAVRAAAAQHRKDTSACEQRGLKLRPMLETEAVDAVNRKTEELNLECRWQTLRLRDRLLEALRSDGQVALRQWVEAAKADIRVSVPKKELDFYLKPK